MTLIEFLINLAKVQKRTNLTLSPGPLVLSITEVDGRAARILLPALRDVSPTDKLRDTARRLAWLAFSRITPEDEEQGDWFERIMPDLTALWWLWFWTAIRSPTRAPEPEAEALRPVAKCQYLVPRPGSSAGCGHHRGRVYCCWNSCPLVGEG